MSIGRNPFPAKNQTLTSYSFAQTRGHRQLLFK